MSRKIEIGPLAEAEIAEIWDYSAAEFGSDAADAYVTELDAAMRRVLDYPLMGTDCSDVRKGYRRIRAGSHLIYYIPHKQGVEIIRLLHVRRDAKRLLRDS